MSETSVPAAQTRQWRWRPLAAMALSPLVLTPFLVLSGWKEIADAYSHSPSDAVLGILRTGFGLPYLVGGPAGVPTIALRTVFKAPNRTLAIAPLYVATCVPVIVVILGVSGEGGGAGPLVGALLLGGPMSLAFCLLLGTRWR
jgi:hypothetical protein